MTWWQWLLIPAGAALAIYAAFVAALVSAGRRQDARALVGFIPDCIVLFRRLLADQRVSRRPKLLLAALIGYLALPIDLVPDFIPVAGQLDDAIIVALVLRSVLGAGGPQLLREHWPGPLASLNVISRVAYGTLRPRVECVDVPASVTNRHRPGRIGHRADGRQRAGTRGDPRNLS